MLLTRLRSLRHTALFGWLLLFLLARGMLAPGFMPTFSGGGISIQLCTPQGAHAVWLGGERTGETHGSLECPFGAALALGALPSQPAAPVLDRGMEAPSARPAPSIPARPIARYRARGPPSLA